MAKRGLVSAGGEKPKDKKRVLKRLWKYLCLYKGNIALAIFLSVAGNLLSIIGPKLSGEAIDAIGTKAGEVNFERVFFFCGIIIVFYVVSASFSYLLSRVMINLSQKVIYTMRKDVFNKIAELPVKFFDMHQVGDIVSRISYDIDTVNSSLSHDLVQIFTSLFTVGGAFTMMLMISPVLVCVVFVTVPIALLFTKYMTAKVRPYFRKRSAKLGELNGFVEEIVSGHKTTKAYNREKQMIGRFDAKNEEAVGAYYESEYLSSRVGPSINFVNNLSLALISVIGSVLYILGKITLGNLSSFVLYSKKFSGPINEVANIVSELQSAGAAAERIFLLIDEESEPQDIYGAEELKEVFGDVKFENVKFGYDSSKSVIHDFSLDVKRGKTVAIVGHTGAGKTTLINLMMRFYDPQSGAIYIDGKNILNLTRVSLRKAFAMVLQDTWLFCGTIYENLVYGKKDATIDDVKRACKAARIDKYIESLKDGYNTVLSENATNISQGQKQLLTIARAMLLDSSMLIFDEATSNVDTRTELLIQDAMRELMDGKTCFIIAHRLSTIQTADVILVMKDGDVVEIGNHFELLDKNGVYAELFNAQFR